MLNTSSIIQIRTSRPDLYAFRINGQVSRDDMNAMAEVMNEAFSAKEKVDMLLIFDRYDGAETGASFGWESIKSRFRSVSNVNRYVVVGAPDAADSMIKTMGSILPVDAETYDTEEPAWRSLQAEAVAV
jgi:hypothetical protein